MTANGHKNYREHTISAGDGLALYIRDYDAGINQNGTVLCLGGLTRNSKDFHNLASRLCSRYRIIAPDYRGRGKSAYDPDWRHYEPRTYIDDIRHLTTALGIHRFAVIGTSLGGVLGMALGAAMPGSLRGVLLNDIGPAIDAKGLAPILTYMRDTSPLPDWESAVGVLQKTFPHMPASTPDEWLHIAEATFRHNASGQLVFDWDPAILKPFERSGVPGIDLWPYFRSLRQLPVLAVRGALSDFVGDGLWRDMKTALPGLVQVKVEDVGHAPSLGEPSVVSGMDCWLQRCLT